ncbi:unnamed protein product [Soboliphyme baturini]|uniref:Ubiquitin-like domain-containing protein n=1 Tax=Soboliphyme baturini TaxID=241478 RepID=A0A3P8C356_9BILA|nr:unnamed protein product [Soboliphyme baturini]
MSLEVRDDIIAEEVCVEESVPLTVFYKKEKYNVCLPLSASVDQLKTEVEKLTGVPPKMQKLTGRTLLREGSTLRECKLTSGSKVMLIGNKPDQIAKVNTQPKLIDFKAESSEGFFNGPDQPSVEQVPRLGDSGNTTFGNESISRECLLAW